MYKVNITELNKEMVGKGYNQTSFAKAIGIGRDTLRGYFKNYSKMPYYIILRIVEILELSRNRAMEIFFTEELTQNAS